jgi:hypothetical protein
VPEQLDGRKRVHLNLENLAGLRQAIAETVGCHPGQDELSYTEDHDDHRCERQAS